MTRSGCRPSSRRTANYEDGVLHYVGSVRPYLAARAEKAFDGRVAALAEAKTSFINTPSKPKDRDIVWLKPVIVAEVSFLERTAGGELRGSSFNGFRSDKPAEVITEEPVLNVDDLERPTKRAPRRRRPS